MEKVGEIQGYDVIYIPEKDIIFCKNTTLKVSLLNSIIKNSLEQNNIPEKNLTIIKEGNIITFGCLTTTKNNCNNIKSLINRIKKNGTK